VEKKLSFALVALAAEGGVRRAEDFEAAERNNYVRYECFETMR